MTETPVIPTLEARPMTRHARGFTLIELLIVLAIVAILLAIAIASYEFATVKTRRAAAAGCLMELAQGAEREYTANLSYAGTAAPAGGCVAEQAGIYNYSFTAAPTATTFTLQAVPQGRQATADTWCGTMTVNQIGVRTESGSGDVAYCW